MASRPEVQESALCRPRQAGAALLVSILLAIVAAVAAGSARATEMGPSFPCLPMPQDALARLTCLDPALARADIRMVQAYYALRQQVGPGAQKTLRSEILAFMVNTRRACLLPPVEPRRDQSLDPLPPEAATCVASAYDTQRTTWARFLSGPAAEEAARPPERNIALQRKLQSLGFLPADSTIDGVFGTGTRSAIAAWHWGNNRPATDFLSNADADILLGDGGGGADQAAASGKPLAEAEFRGAPVTLTYQNLQVSMAIGTGGTPELCRNSILSLGEPGIVPCRAVVERIVVEGQVVETATLARCTLATTPDLPAALITADRSRGVEDSVSVLASDADGKPATVRVEQPAAKGLVSSVTFHRGASRCEMSRQARQMQLQNLQ